MNGPLDILGRATYPPQPLGGDIAGRVTGSSVTVQLPCEEGTAEDKSVRALWARAEVMPRRGSQVSGRDRDILADTEVETANNLADRLGCAERLANAPDHVPALTAGPVPAARAEGTCAWYGKTGLADRSPYPDEVGESRTDGRVWDESRGLVLSLGHANRVYEKLADAHDWLPTPDMPGEWFASSTPTPARSPRTSGSPAPTTARPRNRRSRGRRAAAPRTRSGGPPPSATAVPRSTP